MTRLSAAFACAWPLLAQAAVPRATPLYQGCVDNVSRALPYCDTKLSDEERVEDILKRLTIDEKISQLTDTKRPFCRAVTRGIERIGLPGWAWLTEVNDDVQGACTNGHCPTVFIGPLGEAASFNRSNWVAKGDVISTEMRAMNNAGTSATALTGFGPNINLVKDPRWGRNSEVPGEDPFLSGSYAVSYIQGMQQTAGSKSRSRKKMLAYVKHYTAYNVETARYTFGANVSQFTFWDTYLPHYEMAFMEGKASGAMCSYFAPNHKSVCGDPWLLNGLIREHWKRPDAVVMSDCAAVANMVKNHYATTNEDASAKALNAGLDVYGGWNDNLWGPPPYGLGALHRAIDMKLTSEKALDQVLRRTLTQKFKLGMFDPVKDLPWTTLGPEVIGSMAHQEVSYEGALQGMVLLKNERNALPLKPGLKLAVVGPLANEKKGLFQDYASIMPNMSIYEQLALVNKGGQTKNATGVQVDSQDASGIAEALNRVKEADAIILALGITKTEEHEAHDRKDILLPGLQVDFAQKVFVAAGKKPVILTVCNGGVVVLDKVVHGSTAIIEAFNPAQQGPRALADLIFGVRNRWGKLPVTIYDDHELQPMTDMSFDIAPGRSYRYYNGTPSFRFGQGLSYTTFSHKCGMKEVGDHLEVTCIVKNTGHREGDEVVMAFHQVSQVIRKSVDHPVPAKKLVGFDRVSLAAGEEQSVTILVDKKRLALTNSDGDYVTYKGKHTLILSRGHDDDQLLDYTVEQESKQVNSHPSQEVDAGQGTESPLVV